MTDFQSRLSLPPDARFLVIRRDNIGDLVCTTPLLQALRERFPESRIGVLANSYNAEVLDRNPYVDDIYVYTKAKHRGSRGLYDVYASRLRMILQLRRARIDCAILASAGFTPRAARFARWIRPRHVIGFIGRSAPRYMDYAIPYTLPRPLHETEDVFRLLAPLGIGGRPPLSLINPDEAEVERAQAQIAPHPVAGVSLLVGVHISARLPSNRLPMSYYADLLRKLHERYGAGFVLFWSPGDANNKLHPGDDDKARELIASLAGVPVLPYPTARLKQLIAGLSLCSTVICSDGGAMHVAAGLGKRILCFFGETNADRWYPWGVDYELLQSPSRNVSDITVDEALAAYARLLGRNAARSQIS